MLSGLGISTSVRVIGDLLNPAAFPAIPVAGNRDHDGDGQKDHDQ